MNAPSASAVRCVQSGGNGRRTVSKCERAITASRSGFGSPLRLVLPSGSEREHRLDQRLELERRAHLADEPRPALAGVPEAMRRAGRHGQDLARAGDQLPVADPEAEAAFEHLEALALIGVHVRGGDEPVRAEDRLDADRCAVRLACRAVKDQDLACHPPAQTDPRTRAARPPS